ncbi:MAG: hypothetical protein AAF236_05005 [Verrucomicrobiota bacterium]
MQATINILVTGLLLAASVAQAQFHQRNQDGSTSLNRNAVQSAVRSVQATPSGMMGQGQASQMGANAFSTMYLNDAQKEAFREFDLQLGRQDNMRVHVWGRSIEHTDGTYTESKKDESQFAIEQRTYRGDDPKTRTLLRRRVIRLNESGNPSESLIYDGRDEFKYRGILVYDAMGRLIEEHIYNSEGTLLRRKIQEYTLTGERGPARVVDLVDADDIPSDLRLVITRQNESEARAVGNQRSNGPNGERRGLFSGNRDREAQTSVAQPLGQRPAMQQAQPLRQTPSTQTGNGSATAQPGNSGQPRRGLNLGRLFGGSRNSENR